MSKPDSTLFALFGCLTGFESAFWFKSLGFGILVLFLLLRLLFCSALVFGCFVGGVWRRFVGFVGGMGQKADRD